MGTGNSLSSLGTANHTMIDFDYETGSTVPLTATTPVIRVWLEGAGCPAEGFNPFPLFTSLHVPTCYVLETSLYKKEKKAT